MTSAIKTYVCFKPSFEYPFSNSLLITQHNHQAIARDSCSLQLMLQFSRTEKPNLGLVIFPQTHARRGLCLYHTGHAYLNCILNFRLCDSYLYYLKINKIP